ncbi:MAG: putative ABC transporter ATP-binding protein [Methanosaeta sp. PtaB.Bin018]|jgi:ABC-2 type transport system ATP-binding protein|nr:ABC transporter ATP-binding protein [Methanothrix sp.]OPX76804.1 MAG: putative ABC transporter ATP-binding protein [Methanosaeta sp. PtaB.Bin018]OPY47406.1 MAG: putative ABC transporter ATP-binding protein [Methanosaeta sp. PtaU1.Bin016]HOV51688.1 ABC transporter ATP-binding protein [Methanothrix sp.]
MREMIAISGLNKDYSGKKVVDCLNLGVAQGELFGFLGPNGAGKTTTIRILTTLTKPSSGRVLINGIDVARDPASVKSEFGVVQQHLSLNRDLTIAENLELHARLHHLASDDRAKRIAELLDYVEMADHADYLVDDVSGGMKRRAMIARALIHRPKLLFLDEPTVGLDAQTRRRVWDLIRKMNLDGTTVFLTTHYIEEAEALCSRVGIIHRGKLIALGTPIGLRQKLGMIAVEMQTNENGTEYRYFPDRALASEFIQRLHGAERIVMRESNLEDVFIEITGQKALGD